MVTGRLPCSCDCSGCCPVGNPVAHVEEGGIAGTIENADGKKYVAISKVPQITIGHPETYLICEDGSLDRMRWPQNHNMAALFMQSPEMLPAIGSSVPSPKGGVKYVQVSCDWRANYFVRDDGVVDRSGTLDGDLMGNVVREHFGFGGSRHAGLAGYSIENPFGYPDGPISSRDKISDWSLNHTSQASCDKYVAASAGEHNSYLVAEDGSVHRIQGGDEVQKMVPSKEPVAQPGCGFTTQTIVCAFCFWFNLLTPDR